LLQNTGDAPLTIRSVTLAGDAAGDYQITADGWSGARLLPGQVAALNLRFAPTTPGSRTALLTVLDDAAGSPHLVPLSGTGTAAVARLSTDSVTFSDQLVGSTSAER